MAGLRPSRFNTSLVSPQTDETSLFPVLSSGLASEQQFAPLYACRKGVWISVMCLMHDSEEYGILRWTLKEIAQAVGCPASTLKALRVKGVLKGADRSETCEPFIYTPRSGRKEGPPVTLVSAQCGPIWYSSRMIRDEYVRQHRGNSARFGEDQDELSSPKPPLGDGSSSPTSSSYSVPNGTDATASSRVRAREAGKWSKGELWKAGKSLLSEAGMPQVQCGSFVGKLCKDYGEGVTLEAVRTAVVERPADPAAFLKAVCQRLAGERGTGPPKRRQNSFETINYREGIAADGSF